MVPPAQAGLPGLRFTVQAPLRYDAREFLVHLYTCMCKAVLADVRLNATSLLRHIVVPLLLPRSIRPAALLRGLSGIALLILAGALAFRAAPGLARAFLAAADLGVQAWSQRSLPRWWSSAGELARP